MEEPNEIGDGRGNLVFLEGKKSLPFEIKRFYYIYDLEKNIKRGFHSHKNLWQALVCPYGNIDIIADNGKEKEHYHLNKSNKILIMGPRIWREIISKQKDSLLFVLASEYYDENDYIRDYDEFLRYKNSN